MLYKRSKSRNAQFRCLEHALRQQAWRGILLHKVMSAEVILPNALLPKDCFAGAYLRGRCWELFHTWVCLGMFGLNFLCLELNWPIQYCPMLMRQILSKNDSAELWSNIGQYGPLYKHPIFSTLLSIFSSLKCGCQGSSTRMSFCQKPLQNRRKPSRQISPKRFAERVCRKILPKRSCREVSPNDFAERLCRMVSAKIKITAALWAYNRVGMKRFTWTHYPQACLLGICFVNEWPCRRLLRW